MGSLGSGLVALSVLAATSLLQPLVVCSNAHADEAVADIEVKNFDVTIRRRSTSGRVYLIQAPSGEALHSGKILLLRKDEHPVMAFRILRDYPEKSQFAAKWVRRYQGTVQLESDQEYNAIEKLADHPMGPLTEQDHADLKELESDIPPPDAGSAKAYDPELDGSVGKAKAYDPELDKTTTPPPGDLSPTDEKDLDELGNLTADEFVPIDRDKYWFTLGFGYFRNNGPIATASSGYFTGLDLKFAKTLKQLLAFHKKDLQDSLALEAGLGYYRPINFAESNDSYTVVPMTLTFRYNVMYSENFFLFGYLGINYNFATGTGVNGLDSQVNTALSQLRGFGPAVGAGGFLRVGPGWFVRVDLGYDLLGLALVLRY